VEARPGEITPRSGVRGAPEWPHEHPGYGPDRVAPLPQDESDTGTVPGAKRPELGGGRSPLWMHHDERRVVLDTCTRLQGTDDEVRFLARVPRLSRSEAERLVEATCLGDSVAA